MGAMKKITVNVYNSTFADKDNYMNCFEMPKYKQMSRTKKFLKNYVKEQSANDFNFGRHMFYVFESNTFVIKESDL